MNRLHLRHQLPVLTMTNVVATLRCYRRPTLHSQPGGTSGLPELLWRRATLAGSYDFDELPPCQDDGGATMAGQADHVHEGVRRILASTQLPQRLRRAKARSLLVATTKASYVRLSSNHARGGNSHSRERAKQASLRGASRPAHSRTSSD